MEIKISEEDLARIIDEAWTIGHDEACHMGPVCSMHQPLVAREFFPAWLQAATGYSQ